jgi:hypothetical protein
MKASLDGFLGRAYAAHHGLSKEDPGDVEMELVQTARSNSALMGQLRTRLDELTDDVCCRCYISTTERVVLMRVVSALKA